MYKKKKKKFQSIVKALLLPLYMASDSSGSVLCKNNYLYVELDVGVVLQPLTLT